MGALWRDRCSSKLCYLPHATCTMFDIESLLSLNQADTIKCSPQGHRLINLHCLAQTCVGVMCTFVSLAFPTFALATNHLHECPPHFPLKHKPLACVSELYAWWCCASAYLFACSLAAVRGRSGWTRQEGSRVRCP